MKKYISSILSLAAICFTACEDVPAPYELKTESTSGSTEDSPVIYSEEFSSTLGDFITNDIVGNYLWTIDYSCAKITAYADGANNKSDSWLISPQIDLSSVDSACVYFKYILMYANSSEVSTNYQLLISSDYDGDVSAATWTTIDYSPVAAVAKDWDTWYECDYIDIPQSFMGGNVTIALRYIAGSKAATWEVKSFAVYKGSHEAYSTAASSGSSSGDNSTEQTLPYSETFESSFGTFKSELLSGSGSWIIDYSTAKATGYANSTYTAGKYYLVSAPVNISEAAHITYSYILRYQQSNSYTKLLISDDYNGNASSATWTTLKNNHTEGSDWSTFASADISIPSEYVGKTVHFALSFECTSTGSATWEVKNFLVEAGEGGSLADNVIEETVIDEDNDSNHSLPYTETFSTSLGTFRSVLLSGSGSWNIDYKTAKATGYNSSSKTYTAGEYLLLSAPITISEAAHISYSYILRYVEDASNTKLIITDDYDGDASTATWTTLKADHTEGSDWSTFAIADVNVPSKYEGKTVRVALSFACSSSSSATWEVKNFAVEAGDGGEVWVEPSLYEVDFTSGFGEWTEQTTQTLSKISSVWTIDNTKGAVADAYDEEATEIESRLVSPSITLPSSTTITLSFTHMQQYFTSVDALKEKVSLQISEDGSSWTTIAFTEYPEAGDKVTYADATADLSAYSGKTIYIAFRFAETKNIWIIKTVSIR